MDLLDRYLAAVAALLPKAQRQDIVAELRDLLLSRMEEKEAELGRPLDRAEREAVLKAFGHPIAVAGRFGTPRSLIGPELYPFYVFAAKAALILTAVVTGIPAVLSVLTGDHSGAAVPARFLSSFMTTGLTLIGALTLVGAAIERGWIKLGKSADWKVADLPRLNGRGGAVKSRFEASFELAATLLFILWWTGAVEAPWSGREARGEVFLSAAGIWTTLYLPILALAVLQLASSLVAVIRPGWTRTRAALEIAGSLGGLALVAVLWSAGRLIAVSPQSATGPQAVDIARLQAVLDQSLQIGLAITAAICLVKLVLDGWRLTRASRPAVS
ncbi:hypothetical protein PMI01_02647 [Caulobacter sp. AP07]|uniref:HAAS signaling domain-containing protein n=1 Tax=Caulobacter sp. AP07 TaxID=1144304 RepID=UPI0002720C08|nr:hypothetical protein [Caulobacter sp. AP07]EJL32072.1 hypothetical protein PMI01_02647 [Caulobacter sp. AP07]